MKTPANDPLYGDEQGIFEIHVKGLVDECWSDYFSGFTITHQPDHVSVLVGAVRDQAALFGVLVRIRDLGIPLIQVVRIADHLEIRSKKRPNDKA